MIPAELAAVPERPFSVAVPAHRIASIDVFRGLTMAVMIFVNALDGVRGLPWWTHHAPARADVMTYVDMVFPFFLFAIGLSLPIAMERRVSRDPSIRGLWAHVILRSGSLVVLGLILANAGKADRSCMGIGGNVWALLGIFSASLFLIDYSVLKRIQPFGRILQGVGLLGVAGLFAIFRRRSPAGGAAWIDPSYPEILGLIGCSYFAVAALYIPTRRWKWAAAVWFVLLIGICALSAARILVVPGSPPIYVWPFGNGALCSIIVAGILTTSFFRDGSSAVRPGRAIALSIIFGSLSLIAGWALAPLGISKIRATPTWSLWCVGAASILFAVLYWICDMRRLLRWTAPFRPAGSNTLTTYLLPDIWDFALGALGIVWWDTHFSSGWPGVVKTVIFTCLMLALAGALTRARIRLQL